MIHVNVMQLTNMLLTHFAESSSPSKATFQIVQLGKVSCGSTMRTENMHDGAQNLNEYAKDARGGDFQVGNAET